MTFVGWSQIAIVLALTLIAAIPLSGLIVKIYAGEANVLTPVLRPVERVFYRLAGVDETREQSWLAYAMAMIAFSIAGFLSLYALQRLQDVLPLNPQDFAGVPPDLAFNTSISFITNTNWQNYAGETTMSHLTQMLGLTVHNFLSAATGLAMAFALVRAFARSTATTVGNFWVDMTRVVLYVLLPMSIVIALVCVALGVPQTLAGSVDVTTLEGAKQTHRARPDGEPGGDQGARHQRRRLLQRQFGPSVREPERLDQHDRDLGAAAGPGRLGPRLRPRCRRLPPGAGDPRRDGRSCSSSASASSTGPRAPAIRS